MTPEDISLKVQVRLWVPTVLTPAKPRFSSSHPLGEPTIPSGEKRCTMVRLNGYMKRLTYSLSSYLSWRPSLTTTRGKQRNCFAQIET